MTKHFLFAAVTALAVGAAIPAQATPGSNLIQNGDFSAGGAFWTVSSGAFHFSGDYAEGNVGGEGVIYQTVSDSPGALLQLDYDFGACCGGYGYASWDGVAIPGSLWSGAYTHFTFHATATGSDTLYFFGRNDPSYNSLDNVSLVSTPEPVSIALLGTGLFGLGWLRRRRAA